MTQTRTRKRPKPSLAADDFLRAVPFANAAATLTRNANGTMLAEVPVRRPRYLMPPLSWILPYSPLRRIELDPTGAGVLDQCDGRRTVESIIENFAARNKLSFREAQLSVTQFLRELTQRGVLAIVGQDQSDAT